MTATVIPAGQPGTRLRVESAWSIATVGLVALGSVARTLVVARFLAPADLGLMGIALLALGCVEAVTSSGVDTALISQPHDVEEDLDPAFTIQAVRGGIVFAAIWLAAPSIAALFQSPAAAAVIRAVSVVALLRGLQNPAVAIVVRRLEFRRMFWWTVPEVLAALALAVVLAMTRRDVWALVIAAIGSQGVSVLASYAMLPRRPRLVRGLARARELLRFGRFVSGARALMYFSVNLDAAVVGATMGTAALGIYQFAARVAELPVVTFTRAVGQVALPAFSSLQASPALKTTYRRVWGTVVAANVAAALAIIATAGVVIPRLVGPRWAEAVPVLRVLAVAMIFRAMIVFGGQFLDALRHPRLTVVVNAARLGVLAAGVLPLAARWGLNGVACAVLLASAAGAALAVVLSERVVSEGVGS